jgi:hypothetical protein
MTQSTNPLNQQTSTETNSEQDWLNSDISCLDEYEPYDWDEVDPITLGKPVRYIPNIGFVIEGDRDNV